jgi:tripartite-type tricarboxylate transporter receptor subunit TctC
MMSQRPLRPSFLLIAFLATLAANSTAAQSGEDFYRDKRIRLLVGSAAGGAYDAFARTVVRHISRYIPGNPNFVVENMPGGGGLLTSNYLYNIAPRDGLVIGMVERGAAIDAIVNAKLGHAKFDPLRFGWIGSPTQEIGLVIVRQPSPIRTAEDLKRYELIVSSTGRTDPTSVYPRMLNKLFDTKFKIVDGYKSSREALFAVERGEVEGHVSGASSGIMRAQFAPWIEQGKVRIVMQVGLVKDTTFAEAPLLTDFAQTSEVRDMMSLMFGQQSMAYPLLAPPDVPAERVGALRNAFDRTMTDSGFLADAERQNLKVDPVAGTQIESILTKLRSTPAATLDRFSALVAER